MTTDSKSATAAAGPALSEGLGSSERHHARTLRIRALQAELRALLDEEASEVCKDLAATKAECASIARAGNRVDAVKLYRNKTGLSLRESLQVVESLISAA
jgi:ribosomal protein L7/L12